MLTHKRLLELVEYFPEEGIFRWRVGKRKVRAGDIAGSKTAFGYMRVKIDYVAYRAHRLAFFYMTGEWPTEEIDHINGDRSDNRWSNLRPANRNENCRNTRLSASSTSGLKGASWCKRGKNWRAIITVNNRQICLGRFNTAEEAHEAYKKAAVKYHKKFANFGR